MNSQPFGQPLGPIAVLDIETEPDPFLAAHLGQSTDPDSPYWLHITGYSIFRATHHADGRCTDLCLETNLESDPYEMLFELDRALDRVRLAGATLVTYNGQSHDVPVIVLQTAQNSMWGMTGLEGIEALPHLDLMRSGLSQGRSKWPSLRDLCAECGIPSDPSLVSTVGHRVPRVTRKSQVDVLATFLLLAANVARARDCPAAMDEARFSLAEYLDQPGRRHPHLLQFARKIV